MCWINLQVLPYFCGELIIRHLFAEGDVEDFSFRVLRRSGRESDHYTVEKIIVELSGVCIVSCLLNGGYPGFCFSALSRSEDAWNIYSASVRTFWKHTISPS